MYKKKADHKPDSVLLKEALIIYLRYILLYNFSCLPLGIERVALTR